VRRGVRAPTGRCRLTIMMTHRTLHSPHGALSTAARQALWPGLGLALSLVALLAPGVGGQSKVHLDQIKLPPGFKIDIYASGVTNARSMALSPNGTVFVGSRIDPQAMATGAPPDAGQVYAVIDSNHDHKADKIVTIAKGLNAPNGVAFRDGALYVAEVSRILRYDSIESRLETPPTPVVINQSFPTDWMHGWKFIAFGPDGKLYVPVGAPCNVCDHSKDEPRYASITRMNPDGTGLEVFAKGIRNTVGFDWHPGTKSLWFTNNGRDLLGDETPPDTLHHAPKAGLDFGFPYCHGGNTPDPEFGKARACSEFAAPSLALGPHVGALGMRFYTGAQFPAEYRNRIFVAQHGSWNRSPRAGHIGYRLSVVSFDGDRPVKSDVFAEGWLQSDGVAWGRPVDVLVMPDGALLVSDDRAGVIYRISYSK
jgi:glucose/arabinose dehydrogenase